MATYRKAGREHTEETLRVAYAYAQHHAIRTVVVAPTLNNVIVLGIIVLIRTFLSIALHMEIEGRWPWQSAS